MTLFNLEAIFLSLMFSPFCWTTHELTRKTVFQRLFDLYQTHVNEAVFIIIIIIVQCYNKSHSS